MKGEHKMVSKVILVAVVAVVVVGAAVGIIKNRNR